MIKNVENVIEEWVSSMEAAFKLKALDAYKSQSQGSVIIALQVQINLFRFYVGGHNM